MSKDQGTKNTRTRKKKPADKPAAKVIPLPIPLRHAKTEDNHRVYDEPLGISLTPNQIFDTIMPEAVSYMIYDQRIIPPEIVVDQVKFENNGNYCLLALVEGIDDDTNTLFKMVCLEIKIGMVYLYADYGSQLFDFGYQQRCVELDWQLAEEALMKAALLIGVGVKKGPVAA